MRRAFSNIIKKLGKENKKILFLTGDLGFNALEEVQRELGDRFINMGVAEQNMISAAAGFAFEGYKVFCYSIAPFIVYRCLEQTRNDVCFHNLPVFLVGNGGGYGYGIMGMSHHTIDDIACLSGLPNMNCYIPAFIEDVEFAVRDILNRNRPAYLRLGLGKNNPYGNISKKYFKELLINKNAKLTILGSGPIMNNIISAINMLKSKTEFDLFCLSKVPIEKLPSKFIKSLKNTKKLLVVEEHICTGGIGERISRDLLTLRTKIQKFKSLYAKGYPGGTYGSQNFQLKMSGLDPDSIKTEILYLLK
jgi:transketolase